MLTLHKTVRLIAVLVIARVIGYLGTTEPVRAIATWNSGDLFAGIGDGTSGRARWLLPLS